MSLSEMVFNRSSIKLVAALAIPSFIGFFFWFSEREATRQIDEYKTEKKKHPESEDVVIKDYTMKEVDDSNKVRWLLSSKTGKMLANGQDFELTGVVVQYFDPTTKAPKMILHAPLGYANQSTKFV